jgi:hypothetical protein
VSLPRAQALLLLDEYEKQHELKNLEKRLPMVALKALGQEIKLGAVKVTANKSRPFVDTIFSKMKIPHLVTER